MTTSGDPSYDSALGPLFRLLRSMDDEIARWYETHGIRGVRPRYSMALIRLHHLGPMTIQTLAAEIVVTHSAMSQTITAMRRDGLVDVVPGEDARTRVVHLTDAGQEIIPALEEEWRATEAAIATLDAELPYPVTQVAQDIETALGRRSFHDRIEAEVDPSSLAR